LQTFLAYPPTFQEIRQNHQGKRQTLQWTGKSICVIARFIVQEAERLDSLATAFVPTLIFLSFRLAVSF
jgi:hypothetical protein